MRVLEPSQSHSGHVGKRPHLVRKTSFRRRRDKSGNFSRDEPRQTFASISPLKLLIGQKNVIGSSPRSPNGQFIRFLLLMDAARLSSNLPTSDRVLLFSLCLPKIARMLCEQHCAKPS